MVCDPSYRPDAAFFAVNAGIDGRLADVVEPADFSGATLRWRDDGAAGEAGLSGLTEGEWLAHFAQFAPLPGNQPNPLAMRYHGHQFRHYNPQIGDGRGFLFAQVRDASGALMDLGTKGSGQTPHSRTGDGRMTLQSGMREVIAGAYLHALGVKTCRILSLCETGEKLARYDEPAPARGAVMVRYQHSHVRVGHFQRHAYHEDFDAMRALLAHCIGEYFPHLMDEPEEAKPAAFLRAVCVANAKMVASWMAAGFVHGVMNTDNVTVTGTSFDYGPYRFLPVYEPEFTAAYFDQGGIYAYGRQGEAMMWTMQRLAESLLPIGDAAALEEALEVFPETFASAVGAAFVRRLGVESLGDAADRALASAFSKFAFESRVPFAGAVFDWCGGAASAGRAMAGSRARFYRGQAFGAFRAALGDRAPAGGLRLDHDYFAGEAVCPTIDVLLDVWAAIDQRDDWGPFQALVAGCSAMGAAM